MELETEIGIGDRDGERDKSNEIKHERDFPPRFYCPELLLYAAQREQSVPFITLNITLRTGQVTDMPGCRSQAFS